MLVLFILQGCDSIEASSRQKTLHALKNKAHHMADSVFRRLGVSPSNRQKKADQQAPMEPCVYRCEDNKEEESRKWNPSAMKELYSNHMLSLCRKHGIDECIDKRKKVGDFIDPH